MPELRRDPIIGRWVIISTERSRRPNHNSSGRETHGSTPDPFAPGNEEKTPPEILAYSDDEKRLPNKPGWNLRVVPNKYPALKIEGQLSRTAEELYDRMDGLGAHEVIIETEHYNKELEDLEDKRIQNVFLSYKERIIDLKKDPRLEYILVFKNRGTAAGATLSHSHSQLIATPMVPIRVKQKLRGAEDYYEKKGTCIFLDIINFEKEKNERIVEENDDFIAITPFASRFPFEMWIMPKKHRPNYEDIEKSEIVNLAKIMKNVLRKLNAVLNDPPYNFLIHNSPMKSKGLPYFQWHIELMPKLTQTAGFEWGTGFYINPTPPELASKYLREEPI